MTSLFPEIDIAAAAARVRGVVRRTALAPFPSGDPRVELRLKLECTNQTNSFKCRGAWNQVSQLDDAARQAGVVATSSGNHGRALAWAAQRAGVPATIVMPADAYPNKIQACRDHGAAVLLEPTRDDAERRCAELVAAGAVLIHPYDAPRTIAGAGTVGLEIAADWPAVECVVFPVGGGGLLAGSSLALRRALGEAVTILGVEPAGAPSMSRGVAAGESVTLEAISTQVQGLCPPRSGQLNVAICCQTVDGVHTLPDDAIFAAQARLVREAGLTVEPAGAAAPAFALGGLPESLLAGRSPADPLRVVAVVSGGNPAPEQLAALTA